MGRKDAYKNAVPFKKGDDERRNVTGANKGSKWRKTLLADLMSLNVDDENAEYLKLKAKFPKQFNMSEEKNLQLFMELKQISLIFSENESVSQKAISEVKDRIDGKPTQYSETKSESTIQPLQFKIIGKDDIE